MDQEFTRSPTPTEGSKKLRDRKVFPNIQHRLLLPTIKLEPTLSTPNYQTCCWSDVSTYLGCLRINVQVMIDESTAAFADHVSTPILSEELWAMCTLKMGSAIVILVAFAFDTNQVQVRPQWWFNCCTLWPLRIYNRPSRSSSYVTHNVLSIYCHFRLEPTACIFVDYAMIQLRKQRLELSPIHCHSQSWQEVSMMSHHMTAFTNRGVASFPKRKEELNTFQT